MTHHVVIGTRNDWGHEVAFGISEYDRRHHLYTIGKSGTGKTTLLRNLILQDIEAGRGVGVIDPHGDLATDILDHIPRNRIEDVVYFNPADLEYPIGLNLLGSTAPDERHLVASGALDDEEVIAGRFDPKSVVEKQRLPELIDFPFMLAARGKPIPWVLLGDRRVIDDTTSVAQELSVLVIERNRDSILEHAPHAEPDAKEVHRFPSETPIQEIRVTGVQAL